jgi:hypothetical protein
LAEDHQRVPLLEYVVAHLRLQWYVAAGIVTIILLLLLLLGAYLDGPLAERLDWGHLRGPLLPSVVIIYVLAIYPVMGKLRDRAIDSLAHMIPDDSDASHAVVANLFSSKKRWELTSILVGIACGFALTQPWRWVDGPLAVYAAATDLLMLGILGLLVFDSMNSTLRISQLSRRHIKVDIFATRELVPVANWSLGIALAFVGGISVSIAFQSIDNLLQEINIILNASLILVAVVVFFLSMWSTRTAIVRAKHAELAIIRRNLDIGFHELRNMGIQNRVLNSDTVNSAISAWAAYEQRVHQVSDWPYDARIARRLAASFLVPSAVYLLKLLFGISL